LNYREGTNKEKAFILETEKEIMKELGCDSKQKIIKFGLWEIFKNKIDDIILKKLNIAFYYKSYKIIFNEKHIKEAINDIFYQFELTEDEKIASKIILNNDVMDRTIKNAENRHDKAIEEKSKIIGKMKNDTKGQRTIRRTKENYINDNRELGNNLIIKGAVNIKEIVKRIKLEIKEEKSIDEILQELLDEID